MGVSAGVRMALAGLALMSAPGHGQTGQTDLEHAKELARAGKFDQSLALLDPIIAQAMLKDAKDPDAICPSTAVAVLQTFMKGKFTVSVQNDWCEAMLVKAYALNELKRSGEAEQVLKALVGHAPQDANYLVEYAYTVRVNGDLDRSLDLYQRAEKVASSLRNKGDAAHWRAVALRGQGYCYTDMKRWDDAIKAYQRSLKYEPDDEIARRELRYIEENRPH